MTYNFDEIIDRRNTNSENVEGWCYMLTPMKSLLEVLSGFSTGEKSKMICLILISQTL